MERVVGRADSGFCREELIVWCQANRPDHLLGLAKNERLQAEIAAELAQAAAQYQQTGRAARIFKGFTYRTRESWSRARRVVATLLCCPSIASLQIARVQTPQ